MSLPISGLTLRTKVNHAAQVASYVIPMAVGGLILLIVVIKVLAMVQKTPTIEEQKKTDIDKFLDAVSGLNDARTKAAQAEADVQKAYVTISQDPATLSSILHKALHRDSPLTRDMQHMVRELLAGRDRSDSYGQSYGYKGGFSRGRSASVYEPYEPDYDYDYGRSRSLSRYDRYRTAYAPEDPHNFYV